MTSIKTSTKPWLNTEKPSYREVLKAVGQADELEPSHDVRDVVLRRFKELGGMWDRWEKRDLGVMADCITRMEDILEYRKESPKRAEARLTLKTIRRKLEWYVWP